MQLDEGSLTDQIIQQLEQLQQNILNREKVILSEVLALEQVLNNMLSTTVVVRQKASNKDTKQEKPEQFNVEKVSKKLEQMLIETEQQQIDVTQPVSKIIKKQQLNYKLQPPKVVQKKAPVPTVNRSSDAKSTIPRYIPPRNKNEVTGKVTQNKIMTQQKTFKPQSNAIKNSHTSKTTAMNSKVSSDNEKTSNSTKQTSLSSLSSNNINDKDNNAVSEYKSLRSNNNQFGQMKYFRKDMNDLIQEIQTKKQGRKQENLKPLMQKYHKEQMGHKAAQEKKRQQFLNKFSAFSAAQNSCIPEITASLVKRHWQQYPYIFGLNELVQDLQSRLDLLAQQQAQDLRLDPKEVFRVQVMKDLIGKELESFAQTTQMSVPDKIEMTFTGRAKQKSQANKDPSQSLKSQFNFGYLYQKLQKLLHQIQDQDSLSAKKISQIRMLVDIIHYKGKRSSTVVLTQQFNDWRQFYQTEE